MNLFVGAKLTTHVEGVLLLMGVDNFLVVRGLKKKDKVWPHPLPHDQKTATDSVPISRIAIEFTQRNNSGMNIFGKLI